MTDRQGPSDQPATPQPSPDPGASTPRPAASPQPTPYPEASTAQPGSRPGPTPDSVPRRDAEALRAEVLATLTPVVNALGATLIPSDLPPTQRPGPVTTDAAMLPTDIVVRWRGKTVAYVRPEQLHETLDRMVANLEQEAGVDFAAMDRAQKQRAVRQLDEQGAFMLRGAVEYIAKRMDVSRVTLYSYLNAIRTTPPTPQQKPYT